MGPEASVGRDVSFIGGMFESRETTLIERDLNLVSLDADIAGNTGRDVNALVGPLRVGMVLFDFMKNQGWLPQTTEMDLQYPRGISALGSGLTYQSIGPLVLISSAPAPVQQDTATEQWQEWGIALAAR